MPGKHGRKAIIKGGAVGNAFLEMCEIADHKVTIFTKLPTFALSILMGKLSVDLPTFGYKEWPMA